MAFLRLLRTFSLEAFIAAALVCALFCRTAALPLPPVGKEHIFLRAHSGAVFFNELCSYLEPQYRAHTVCSMYLQLWKQRFERKFMSRRVVADIAAQKDVDPRELYFVSRDMIKFVEMGFTEELFLEALDRAPIAPLFDKASADYARASVWEESSPHMLYRVQCSKNGKQAMRYTVYGRRIRDLVFDSALGLKNAWFQI